VYKAQLVGVYTVGEMPEELRPFLNLQARREKRELKMGDRAAVLQVRGTTSYIVAFLDSLPSVAALEEQLAKQDTELDATSKVSLERVLQEARRA